MNAGIFKALGQGLQTTANTAISLNELKRRAEEDAKRLRISMERLELTKRGMELDEEHRKWSREFQEKEAEEATRQWESGDLFRRLQAEQAMVQAGRATEDRLNLEKVLHGYDKEIEQMRTDRATAKTGKTTPVFKSMELSDSTLNKALAYAQSRMEYEPEKGFKYHFDQAVNSLKGVNNPWHMGGIGPRAFGKPATKKKTTPKSKGDIDKMSPEELMDYLVD